MTDKEYREHPAISRSELFKISESPEKFRWCKDHPQEPTPALLFGQLFHKMALEPETLWNDFTVAPTVDRRTKAGKEEYAKFLENAAGKTVVTMEMVDQASEMCEAIKKNPFAVKLLSGAHETPYFWTDPETGEPCKCRTDCTVSIGGLNLVVDLKTTTNAETDAFMREAVRYGYDFQAGMYTAGVDAVTGRKHGFVFIAIEKDPPYAMNILQADDLFMRHGRMMYREYLGIYHDCQQTGKWWGYMGKDGTVNNLSLPAWVARDVE